MTWHGPCFETGSDIRFILMTSTRIGNLVMVIAFMVLGFFLAPVFFVWGAERIFFTTKPFVFLTRSDMNMIALVLSASLGAISFSALMAQRFDSSFRYRNEIPALSAVWMATFVFASLLVSIMTAGVHEATLDIPEGLIAGGLLFIPGVAAAVVLLFGFRKARRHLKQRVI